MLTLFARRPNRPAPHDAGQSGLRELQLALKQQNREIKQLKSTCTALERDAELMERVVQRLLAEADALPLPPPELRDHVGRGPEAGNFLAQGMSSSRRVLELFGTDPGGPVLDWGCGSGRTLAWLFRHEGWRENYFGCDVDADAIAWLREKGIPRVEVCGDLPPLPYADGAFAALFSFSVLTHIPPERHAAWYVELHRVLQPGGRAYVTVHGDDAINSSKSISNEERDEYSRRGWSWSEREGHYKHASVVSKAFTLAAIGDLFEVEEHRPSGYHQMDAMILRKLG
jgi:SAM-dependent methyltransferase